MFDGYLLSFLSTYLSINDIVHLTRSSILFREPILLETLERRILSECSIRISDKQVIPLSYLEKGVFIFENTNVLCNYFGHSTNNYICLCDSNELKFILPSKTIVLDIPIAEMYHNYKDGNTIREYYDICYTIKIYFGINQGELFINTITFEFMKQELTFYQRFLDKFRNMNYYLGR
jgi:hypothetical protein